MRRSRATVLGATLVLASMMIAVSGGAFAAPAPTPAPVPSPYDYNVALDVVLTARVSSEIAKPGDEFYFKTVSDVNLGRIDVPAGTPGLGRLAIASAATHDSAGQLALQADYLTVGDAKVWVNIDTTITPRGHLSTRHDLVLDPGMKFRVTSILARKADAPLVQSPPSPTADVPLTGATGATGAPAATPTPAMEPQPSASPSP